MKAGIPEITREGDIQHLIKLCKLLEEKTHSFKYKSRSPNNLVKHLFFFVHICAFFSNAEFVDWIQKVAKLHTDNVLIRK